jgi:tRNA pseudouridine38-40 synthase
VQRALNLVLAPEVVVRSARRASDGFDARRSATGREYLYRVDTASVPNPLTARFAWHHPGWLHLSDVRRAARFLIGEHDFASFCRAPKLPMSTTRRLRRLAVSVDGEEVRIRAVADGFLHQMVRSLAGTLVAVGEGKLSAGAMPQVLAARNRTAAGPVAPAHGLVLVRVLYGRRRASS